VKLTPEIHEFIRSHLEAVQGKLEKGERLTEEDLAFMDEARGMVAAERLKQIELAPQYGKRLETLKFFGFLGEDGGAKKNDVPAPAIDKVMASFSPEELAVAKDFQEPTLLLIPETSFASKVAAINAHKTMERQGDTYVDDIFAKSDSGTKKISGWKVVIVDGAKEMECKEGDDLGQGFGKRIEKRKVNRRPGEKGMERHAYALLMMEALRIGELIDRNTYTLLDDDPALLDSDVPFARWSVDLRRVNFSRSGPGLVNGKARLHSAVGGGSII
jgi:hypothetical protein